MAQYRSTARMGQGDENGLMDVECAQCGCCPECVGVSWPAHVGLVPVYCRVVQRSAVLWRQIAVGCWSTDHSDPKRFPGVLRGRQRQLDFGGQGRRVKIQFWAVRHELLFWVIYTLAPRSPREAFFFSISPALSLRTFLLSTQCTGYG